MWWSRNSRTQEFENDGGLSPRPRLGIVQLLFECLTTAAIFSYNTNQLYNHMVYQGHPQQLDATFAALADPTRRAILARLALGEATVNDLAEPFAMSQPAISKHLKVLEAAGLISRGRDAQRRPSRLEPKRLAEASAWLEQYRKFWETSFNRLDDVLDELQGRKTKHRKQ
jgi:DNA-binding transcriptional ArsR family regulator